MDGCVLHVYKEIKATGEKIGKQRRSKREIFHVHACNWWAPLPEFHICKCKTSTKLCMHTFIRHFTWNRKIKHFWAARLKFHFFLFLFDIIRYNATSPFNKIRIILHGITKYFFTFPFHHKKPRMKGSIILTKFQKWNQNLFKFCFPCSSRTQKLYQSLYLFTLN